MAAGGIWKGNIKYVGNRVNKIWENLGENSLWKRMLKNIIATTAAGRPPLAFLLV